MGYKVLFVILIAFKISTAVAQQPSTIHLPPGGINPLLPGGTMVYDVIYDNLSGKMFVYSTDRILVYTASNHQYVGEIPLGQYGKFNPVYFNSRLHVVDIDLMAINNEGGIKLLYVVTPNLHILAININNIQQTWDITPYVDEAETTTLQDLFTFQNGKVLIKYDNRTDRLFLLVAGKDIDAANDCPGVFHSRTSFFGIYDVDNGITPNNTTYINLYYPEINLPDDPYKDQINNFVFNEVADFYYVARLSKPDGVIDIMEITPNGSDKVDLVTSVVVLQTGSNNYYKFGKMLYINNISPHKIIALPYRYPSTTVTNPKFCVIDGDHTNVASTVNSEIFDSPSKRILDAVFLKGTNNQPNDLILSYAPENSEIPDNNNHGTDIAIFHFNGTTFVPGTPFTYNTEHSINTSIAYDINSSFKLIKVDANTVLVGKKDEIVKLSYDGSAYVQNLELSGESNFFRSGASGAGSSFIINTVANGIETFNNGNHNNITSNRTGYPVYHITANTDGSKLYFYNTLNAYNTGLYVYGDGPAVNINDLQLTIEEGIETAIGDCIYNPFTNQFLVSENSDFGSTTAGKIKVFDEDNTYFSTISLIDTYNNNEKAQFPKDMFIAPNKKLYVMANMHNGLDPKIFVYDANDYSLDFTHELDMPSFSAFDFYSAHFSYNPHNQAVYVSVHPTEITLDPYHTVTNSMFDFGEPFETENMGLFIKIDHDQVTTYDSILYPGKIICPDIGNYEDNSQYDGKMFIIGKEFAEYDEATGEIDIEQESFNDITYSAAHDRLFAIRDGSVDCNDDRECEIWSIDYVNDYLEFNELGSFAGQATSIFANPYDGQVYIYNKIDDAKLGGTETRLYSFDLVEGFALNYTSLGMTSYYPELDHCPDYHYYFYNITTPYINPYTNDIYVPNGAHSSISKISYTPNEAMYLSPGLNWISIPRHYRDAGHPEWTLIEDVFDQNNFTGGYNFLNLLFSNAEFSPAVEYESEWESEEWTHIPSNNPDVTKTYSTRGYKLNLNQPSNSNTLIMTGTVEDPATYIDLYPYKYNWAGYFIYEEQDIFDALGSIKDDIYQIIHQHYFCYFGDIMDGPSDAWPVVPGHTWHCDQQVHNIKYGEMVEIKSRNTISGFIWDYSGNTPSSDEIEEPEYFAYTEEANYTPMMVELDTTGNPIEIGAFVNDTCIGACTVMPDDTVVGIKAYMGGQTGDITFEEYYGTKSTQQKTISEYYVYNKLSGISENRKINTSEKSNHFFVSFRQRSTNKAKTGQLFTVFPNPANDLLSINYSVDIETNVNISVFDSYGRYITTLLNYTKPEGSHGMQWNLRGNNGKKLPKGLYIIKLTINNVVMSRKVVVN